MSTTLTRRWRRDGSDWITGSRFVERVGGAVEWRVFERWAPFAWVNGRGWDGPIKSSLLSAQRAVERWLAKHAGT